MTKSLPRQLLLAALVTTVLLALLPLLQDTAGTDERPQTRPTTTHLVTVLPLPPDATQPPDDADPPAPDAPPQPAEPTQPPTPAAPAPPSPVAPDSPPPPPPDSPVRLDIPTPSVTLTPPLPDLPRLDILPTPPSPQPILPDPPPLTPTAVTQPAATDADATATTPQPPATDASGAATPTSAMATDGAHAPSPSPSSGDASRSEVTERHLVRPVFPRNVPRVSGTIELSFTVRPDGTVTEVTVERCAPQLDASYRREAIRAARRSLYRPRTVQGRPVAARVRRRIDFVVQP